MIHPSIARISRRIVRIWNKGKQIKAVVESHGLHSTPTLRTLTKHKVIKEKKTTN